MLLYCLFWALPTSAQVDSPSATETTASYFTEIAGQEAFLRQFFQRMPKGGDLHHHFSGSVYPETYIDVMVERNFWLNTHTFEIAPPSESVPSDADGWERVGALATTRQWKSLRLELLYRWSALHYSHDRGPSDEHFFTTFDKFWPVVPYSFAIGLQRIKDRAKREHMSYLETQLRTVQGLQPYGFEERQAEVLLGGMVHEDSVGVRKVLDALFQQYQKESSFARTVQIHNAWAKHLHDSLALDDDDITIRFQNYGVRVIPDPVAVFRNLVAAFHSANTSELIVGVNLVAPEHYPTSMDHYWLHMQMFGYLRSQYPEVRVSLHAGELTLGLVRPEDLQWHITSAVHTAGAHRIGHGVDVAYEQNSRGLLNHMKELGIAVEICPVSSDFILGVAGDEHPFALYRQAGVPIVISTDDAGILRTDLTDQYVQLALQYPELGYADIKELVYNSIRYSFLTEAEKKQLISKLDEDFRAFEQVFGKP